MKKERTIPYCGNKFKIIDWVFENFPKDLDGKKVLDGFGGSGVISHNMTLNFDADVTYNEFNEVIYEIVKNVFKGDTKKTIERVLEIENESRKAENLDEFFKLKNKELKETHDIYLATWMSYKTFGANYTFDDWELKGKGYSIKTAGGVKTIKQNKKINMTNDDFFDIDLNNYDFVYLDPPYWNSGVTYGHTTSRLIDIFEKLEKYDGKFLMSYYFDENIFYHCKKRGWNIKIKEVKNTLHRGQYKKVLECLISNYE